MAVSETPTAPRLPGLWAVPSVEAVKLGPVPGGDLSALSTAGSAWERTGGSHQSLPFHLPNQTPIIQREPRARLKFLTYPTLFAAGVCCVTCEQGFQEVSGKDFCFLAVVLSLSPPLFLVCC